MRQERDARLAPPRPVGLRIETLRGEARPLAGAPVGTVARRLSLWWPGGAWVYAWPVAIEVVASDGTRRTRRIGAQRARVAGLLATLGAMALAVYLARRARPGAA